MEDFPIADSLAGTGKAQRLNGNVQPKLVSILETINYRARDPVDANGNAIDWVHFDAMIESRNIKTIDLDRRRAEAQPRVPSSRHSQVNGSRYLRRDTVEGKRRNQAHNRVGGFGRHYREVRIAELAGGGQPIEPARESRKLAIRDEPVQRRWMNPLHQGLTRSHHAPVLTEGFEGGLDIASLSHSG
jgi:hypothetical protein